MNKIGKYFLGIQPFKILIFIILILAFLLRFWNVWNQDLFGDEAPDAFRAIGYIDYLGTSFQTQPIDWYKNTALPWWTSLSFHDFPPLAMIIQHAFFAVFGDSLLVARLPAIILGVISVFLLYLIAKKFFENEILALFSALFFAINSEMVWIFRTSMLEPILLFFILLNIYFFYQFIYENKSGHYWWLFGISLGLVTLTKYTGVFLLPVYILYILITKREIFKNWRLYAAFLLAILLFLPVIIYNIYLYKATGHFDLQISYFLGQETPEWTGLVGKIQSPFSDILKNLMFQQKDSAPNSVWPVGYYGLPAILAVLGGIVYSLQDFLKKKFKGFVFFSLYFIFVTLLLFKIGSAHRFLALYGPAFAIFAGYLVNSLWNLKIKKGVGLAFKALIFIFFIWELSHSINTNFIQYPNYGMANLDNFFRNEFRGRESAVVPESDNPHLNDVIGEFVDKKSANAPRALWLVIYNDNVALPTLEWIYYKMFFYHSIPAMYVENFNKAVSIQGSDYFKGFDIYFVQSTENTPLNQFKKEKTAGLEFENRLQKMGLQPMKIIHGQNNLPMFRIYKFSL
ncbi:MAG: glycosyltransferase family 39 protein [bacterium]|nr:glycosyltransferase family 39 protein [bacterium]